MDLPLALQHVSFQLLPFWPAPVADESQAQWLRNLRMSQFVARYLQVKGDLAWSEAAFLSLVADIRYFVINDTVPVIMFAALNNLTGDVDEYIIADDIKISKLPDDERRDMYEVGTLWSDAHHMEVLDWSFAIQVVGRMPRNSMFEPQPYFDQIARILTSLRLAQAGDVVISRQWWSVSRPTFILGPRFLGARAPHRAVRCQYQLTADALPALREGLAVLQRHVERQLV